jgi:hypothetical protein
VANTPVEIRSDGFVRRSPMKNTKLCPKCNGSDILKIPGKSGPYGSGNNIQTGWTIFSAILVHRYLCCSCGFSEEWIDQKDIQKLKDTYSK